MFVIHDVEEGEPAQNETIAEYDADWSYPEGTEPTTHYDESEEAVTGQRDAESGSSRPVRTEALTASTPLGPQEIGSDFAVFDSGATHVLLPLRERPLDRMDARTVRLRLAAGRVQTATIVDGEIYAAGVHRPLCPMGKTVEKLNLQLRWEPTSCSVYAK